MAIQTGIILMRRGSLADFEAHKNKLQPGEFAVTLDTDTHNKKVFMNFGNNVIRELGTLDSMMDELQKWIDPYDKKFTDEYNSIVAMYNNINQINNEFIVFKSDLLNTYLPQILNSLDLAKSYAVGDTGIRTDEDTDNAKYYKEWVENAFNMKLPIVTIDFTTGELMYVGGVLTLDLNRTTGMLEWYM